MYNVPIFVPNKYFLKLKTAAIKRPCVVVKFKVKNKISYFYSSNNCSSKMPCILMLVTNKAQNCQNNTTVAFSITTGIVT